MCLRGEHLALTSLFFDAVTRNFTTSIINASSLAAKNRTKFNFDFIFCNRSFPHVQEIMRELRELQLPKLLEARESRAAPGPSLPNCSPLNLSQSSASSDSTILSPTFSLRSPAKFSSATSSVASSPTMRSSLDDYSPKRQLTDVREEPVQEKDDGFEMVDAIPRDSDCESQP